MNYVERINALSKTIGSLDYTERKKLKDRIGCDMMHLRYLDVLCPFALMSKEDKTILRAFRKDLAKVLAKLNNEPETLLVSFNRDFEIEYFKICGFYDMLIERKNKRI